MHTIDRLSPKKVYIKDEIQLSILCLPAGDDGSPVLLNGGSADKDVVVGVVHQEANGIKCGTFEIPSIFSHLSPEVREWINLESVRMLG